MTVILLEDCAYVVGAEHGNNMFDVEYAYVGDNYLQETSGLRSTHVFFTAGSYSSSFVYYCYNVNNLSNAFGCANLKSKDYTILNKQYSKEDYEVMKEKVIGHMKETGEWGQFFPASCAILDYNESRAMEDYPLTQPEAEALGYSWREEEQVRGQGAEGRKLPDEISEITDEICSDTLSCVKCSKVYKIIPQELEFYKKMVLPLPRSCKDCRYRNRMDIRNPMNLWKRNCSICETDLYTSFSPEGEERICCEECYKKEVY